MEVSRPGKLTYAQTILYEIHMLRYTAETLTTNKWREGKDQWVYLEAFLLHYRNLIEFFGRPGPRADDLHITKSRDFWPVASALPKAEFDKLFNSDLWDKYEDDIPDKISKYLHHCTKRRIDPKTWDIGIMYGELEPVLAKFVNLLSDEDKVCPWRVPTGATIAESIKGATGSGPSQ